MDHTSQLETGNDVKSNPLFIAQSPPLPLMEPKSSIKPRWTRHFQVFQKATDSAEIPDSYITRSRDGHLFPRLTSIDSTAGKVECKAQTAKQWDTIIQDAKISDKVSRAVKAAKFFYFGFVVRDLKPTKPSRAYKFIRRLTESEAQKELEGKPLPLGDYDAKRRLKTLHRNRVGSVTTEPIDVLVPSFFSSQSNSPVNEPEHHYSGTTQQTVVSQMHTSVTQLGRVKTGLDLSYSKYAAEDQYNDYELVKGIGRVPINQKAPEPTGPVDKPWSLSPTAWAMKDFRCPLQKMISSDLTINNLMILPSALNVPTLDDDESLHLRWSGATEQRIIVFKDSEIKSFSFKNVTIIKYNQKELKVFFEFLSESSNKLEELLLVLLPVPNENWLILQTCCYSLAEGQIYKQCCDFANPDFFESKIKALMGLRIKRAPTIPGTHRHIPAMARRGQSVRNRPRRSNRTMFQTRRKAPFISPLKASDAAPGTNGWLAISSLDTSASGNTTPKEVASPYQTQNCHNEISEASIIDDIQLNMKVVPGIPQFPEKDKSNAANSKKGITDVVDNPKNSKSSYNEKPHFDKSQDSLTDENEESGGHTKAITKDMNIRSRIEKTASIDTECVKAPPVSLYYRSVLKSGVLIQVHLNDLVVRLRSEAEREKKCRRDRLDIFDGPWRIIEFGKPKSFHNIDNLAHQEDEDGSKSPEQAQLDMNEVKKMLKTKVRLGFPRGSQAKCWVELNLLLPMTKIENVLNGKLHASCWSITELTAFKALRDEMKSRNLEAFDPKYHSFTAEKLGEDHGSATEQTAGADENDDENEEEPQMHVVEIKPRTFVAIVEADPKAVDDGDSYLVEKLRAKQLRLYKLNSAEVRKQGLKTDNDDLWVKRLMKEAPHLATNRIVVSEYKVHWAGWPDEDDSWTLGLGNIAKGFIEEFDLLTDIMRNVSLEVRMADPRDMVFKSDLPKASKIRNSVNRQSIASSVTSSIIKNPRGREVKENKNTRESDNEEDIALSKAIQASLDEVRAAKTQVDLKALQKEMGVASKEKGTNVIPHYGTDYRNKGLVMRHGPDIDDNDVFMAEDDEVEDDICYQEEGLDDGDED